MSKEKVVWAATLGYITSPRMDFYETLKIHAAKDNLSLDTLSLDQFLVSGENECIGLAF